MFPVLRHRNFRLFIAGQVVSLTGTWMQSVAQSWLVYRLTHSELLLGTAWFCAQIPVFALGPLAGLVCDRQSRHKLVIATQVASMLQAFVLAGLTISGKVEVWHILTMAVVLGCINAFDMPARQSLIVQLANRDDLLPAISLNSAIFNAARIIGPGIAGLLVAWIGEGPCFLVNGFSFLAVIGCLLAMRLPPFRPEVMDSPFEHLMDGFRYTWQHIEVRRILMVMAATTISGAPALVLMPFFADSIFHTGSRGLGVLMGGMGIGAVIGTLVLARRKPTEGLLRVIISGALTLGATLMAFAWSPSFWLSLALMPLIGYSVMRQMAAANTTIQTSIPDHYRGRVMAMYSMAVVGMGPFGSLASGAIAHAVGARWTVFAGGVLCVSAASVFAWSVRKIKLCATPEVPS